jgi:hypothetical protein
MATYFHVAPAHYQDGDDLLSFEELEAQGYGVTWKYEGEPVDTDVVCLFETEVEARSFIADFLPDGRLLRVTIPADADDIRMTRVEEGYPAVFRLIPAQYVEAM